MNFEERKTENDCCCNKCFYNVEFECGKREDSCKGKEQEKWYEKDTCNRCRKDLDKYNDCDGRQEDCCKKDDCRYNHCDCRKRGCFCNLFGNFWNR